MKTRNEVMLERERGGRREKQYSQQRSEEGRVRDDISMLYGKMGDVKGVSFLKICKMIHAISLCCLNVNENSHLGKYFLLHIEIRLICFMFLSSVS